MSRRWPGKMSQLNSKMFPAVGVHTMNFKRSMMLGAFAAAISFSACTPPGGASSRASGSLALSHDDSTVFAVDTDNGVLARIDAKTRAVQLIPVGQSPARVVIGPDDTAFVSNRGGRSVSVIRKGDSVESARIDVSVEPTGMALSGDGKTLLVVSATALDRTDQGTLTAIDTNTLQKKWEILVGEEPRAVAIIAGNRAMVSLFKTGELVEVDLGKGAVISSKTGIYDAANATRVNGNAGAVVPSSFRPRAMNDLVVTAQGDRLFAPVVWAREDKIGRVPNSSGGYYAAGGPCNIGAVATAGIITVDTANTPEPQVDDLTSCFTAGTNSSDKDFPSSTLASINPRAAPIQGPTVGVLDPTGSWLVVLNRETQNVAFMPAWKRNGTNIDFEKTGTSIRTVVDIKGQGADGLAMTGDGKRVYVYSQFDHKLEIFDGQGAGADSTIVSKGEIQVTLEAPNMTPDVAVGRKLFFNARDIKMSAANTNVACSTCHLEGREDGHVWQFPDGARQTPSLAGRQLIATAPYHWSGEFASLAAFNVHTIKERMGGSGLDYAAQNQLDTFIDQMPLAENPMRGTAELRGRAAFEKASCGSCHTGALFTNNTNADVGTLRIGTANSDNGLVVRNGFNVPSLLGLGRTAPYLHDGSQLTLEERVFSNVGDKHGVTSVLSTDERSDLITYLKSL